LAGVRRRPSGELPPLPRHFSPATQRLLGAVGIVTIVWLVLALDPTTSSWISAHEGRLVIDVAARRTDTLSSVLTSVYDFLYVWAVPIVGWTTIVVLVVYQRWRHLFVFFVSLLATVAVVVILQGIAERPRPYGVTILGRWADWSAPSRPIAVATTVLAGAALALVPPGRGRRIAATAVLVASVVYALMETYLGVSHPTDQVLAILIGGAVPLLAFRFFAPEAVFPVSYRRGNTAHLDITGVRGEAIRRAVREQLGLTVLDVQPVGLAGSAGSTPLRLTVTDAVTGAPHDPLFAKLLARSHLRSDRFYKLFRTLRYGRLEDENKFLTVRRLVQQEDYLALRMAAAGIRVPLSLGVIEITPEREYMVVTEFLDGFVEIGDAPEMTVPLIDNALAVVRKMWDAGLAHRDVKPSNVMVRGDDVALIDVAFGQIRPSPWRQAVDLANMMLVLALRSSPELVYERACRQFTVDEIAEAFAASRGITLPSQVRHQMRADGRDLLADFRRLGPSRPTIKIQRWSWRRIGLTVWVGVVAIVLAGLSVAYLRTAGLLP
jgi:tRNA A-37 threonylcarbamoyl transferase component Bud32